MIPKPAIVAVVPAGKVEVVVPIVKENSVTFKSLFAVSTSESLAKTLPVALVSSSIV